MKQVIARRLLLAPIVLLVASVLIFLLVQVVPGDPAQVALGPYATDDQLAIWRQQHGLGGHPLARYWNWLGGVVRGNWGDSVLLGVPVRPLVVGRLGNSLLLGLFAFALVTPVALAAGVGAAMRRGKLADRAVTVGALALASTPEFVTGVILLIVFAVRLRWFPVNGQLPDGAGRNITRMARAGTIDVLSSAYYRTAELKGLPTSRIVRRHVLRNALLPTSAVLGTQLAAALGGLVIAETLFNYPGIGLLLVDAARDKDVTVLEACALTTAAIAMLTLLVADVSYGLLDPRIRYRKVA